MTFETELAALLETTPKNALTRAAKLRILPPCGRCGGSGRYSFNQMDDDRCYGCNGTGQQAPAPSKQAAVLTEAAEAKADGRLADYLVFLAAQRETRNAVDRVMAAWKATGISDLYRWQNAAQYSQTRNEEFQRDRDIADINAKMAHAYDRVSKASMGIPRPTHPTFNERVMALHAALTGALADIEAANTELRAYLDSNPKGE